MDEKEVKLSQYNLDMEEIYLHDINFKAEGVIQDKKIKGLANFKDFDFYQANFVNCYFNHKKQPTQRSFS